MLASPDPPTLRVHRLIIPIDAIKNIIDKINETLNFSYLNKKDRKCIKCKDKYQTYRVGKNKILDVNMHPNYQNCNFKNGEIGLESKAMIRSNFCFNSQ